MDVIRKTEPVQQSVSHDEKTHTLEGAVDDGDDALKVLHSHFEPYTKAEEKKVLRKIDLRLILLMFIVNGTQFVDKLVSSITGAYLTPLDNFPSCDIRYHQRSPSYRTGIQLVDQFILHWLFNRSISHELPDATFSDR